MEYKKSY